jgi:type II secretory pathway pseudopilin PulG
MRLKTRINRSSRRTASGFTLVEVVMCLLIIVLVMGSVVAGYIGSCYRAEWSGYNLAAQALAMQQLEYARSAKWDVLDSTGGVQITNMNNLINWSQNGSGVWTGYSTNTLDLPISGTNVIWATNFCSLTLITLSATPAVYVYMVEVQTVWPFLWYNKDYYYTNTLVDYVSPDY